MKQIFLLIFVSLSVLSCGVDDDLPDFRYEFLPIESASIPDEFVSGEIYTIEFSYLKPSTCYHFHDMYYDSELNIRTVAVVTKVFDEFCSDLEDNLETEAFQFLVNNTSGSYIFKFWQGIDENGEDQYLIYEVPVVQ